MKRKMEIIGGIIFVLIGGFVSFDFVKKEINEIVNIFNQKSVKHNYKIIRVVDGDTIEFEANFLPPPLKKTLKLRVDGVDTPEKGHLAKCDSERKKAENAKKFTEYHISKAKEINVIIKKWGKYGGRIVGDIEIDGQLLSNMLLYNNYSSVYKDGKGKKTNWCKK